MRAQAHVSNLRNQTIFSCAWNRLIFNECLAERDRFFDISLIVARQKEIVGHVSIACTDKTRPKVVNQIDTSGTAC